MSSSKYKVLVTRSDLPTHILDKLNEKFEVDIWTEPHPIPQDKLLARIPGKDGLFCLLTDKIDKQVLDAAGSKLKVVSTMSVGYDHLSVEEIKKRNIKIGYTPGVLTNATAELTMALLLATSRRLFDAHRELLNGGWTKCVWSPLFMIGAGISDSVVGIVGLGRIGQAVVERLQGFQVAKFLYSGRAAKPEGDKLGAEFVSLDTLLQQSDFVIVTCALTEETKLLIDASALAKMKKTAVLVNTSRGGLVDQEALIAALKKGQIAAAGLDVMTPEPLPHDHPLISTPNITLLPHIGSADLQTRHLMAKMCLENLMNGLNGDKIPAQLC